MQNKLNKPAPECEADFSYKYGKAEKGTIKKIIIADGSPRSSKVSNTQFLAENFMKGAEEAGAEVAYVKLKDHNIKHCIGCFTCWSATPGKCVHNDDMTELLPLTEGADLVVYASPLYVFGVTGIMKNYMDRLLPDVEPYMVSDENGISKHPARSKENQRFVLLSVAGFPDIKGNFDGMIEMFRCLDRQSGGGRLMGELLMPGAEIMSAPPFTEKKKETAELCRKMGRDIVEKGMIETNDMKTLATPYISKDVYRQMANMYWKSIEGKSMHLKE